MTLAQWASFPDAESPIWLNWANAVGWHIFRLVNDGGDVERS